VNNHAWAGDEILDDAGAHGLEALVRVRVRKMGIDEEQARRDGEREMTASGLDRVTGDKIVTREEAARDIAEIEARVAARIADGAQVVGGERTAEFERAARPWHEASQGGVHMQTVTGVDVGDDVLFYEQEDVPLAAKVTGHLQDGVYVLAVFKPGEPLIHPNSGTYGEDGKAGTFRK
jgi:hypothetical protein